MKKLLFLFVSLGAFLVSEAQECKYYHREFCISEHEYVMNYDGQSRSAILGTGLKSEFHMVAYDGMDYRITICGEENLGGELHLKLFEKKRVLIKDGEGQGLQATAADGSYDDPYSNYSEGSDNPYKEKKFKLVKELVYDNTEDGYSDMIEFTPDGSMSLIVEVSIPGEKSESQLSLRAMGCVGVLIERSRSRQIGF